ncbi:hypothetical protein M3Y96_00539800 [Aphelenchoides besseyi]|nr:hypothetical protein M3Y96_00539800 [Aphelenchoides besseyi]
MIDVDKFDVYYWGQINGQACGYKDKPQAFYKTISYYDEFDALTNDQLKLKTAIQQTNELENENEELRKELNAVKLERDKFSEQSNMKQESEQKSNHLEAFWQLQQQNKLTDFTLFVDGNSIKVHEVFLSAASEFFAQQFEENPGKLEYSIESTTFEAVDAIIKFFYMRLLLERRVQTYIVNHSVHFVIQKRLTIVLKHIKSTIMIDNAPASLIWSVKNDDDKLKKIAIEFVDQDGGKS